MFKHAPKNSSETRSVADVSLSGERKVVKRGLARPEGGQSAFRTLCPV
jgi:hypothetical protein